MWINLGDPLEIYQETEQEKRDVVGFTSWISTPWLGILQTLRIIPYFFSPELTLTKTEILFKKQNAALNLNEFG